MQSNLTRFVGLLAEWQAVHNLVGRAELAQVWPRHIADSLQLLGHAPDFRSWIDLGSGAGFPGVVVAVAAKADASQKFTLVEANAKKSAFLRTAIRTLELNAAVACERIEVHGPKMAGSADVVSARALAPLPVLCRLAAPYLHTGSTLLLLKGREYSRELTEASLSWKFDVVSFTSETDSAGRILSIRNLSPRV